MGAALVRQWLILSLLPRPPQRIDAATIEARLRERGHMIHRRTIQRDLVERASVFPIVSDERSKPYGWRWSDAAHANTQTHWPIPLHPGTMHAGRAELRVTLGIRAALVTEVAELLRLDRIERLSAKGAPATVVAGSVEDTLRTRRVLVAYGQEVEVLEPRELRKDVRTRALAIAKRHE